MQVRQKQVIEMLQRVQDFLGANPPPTSAAYTAQKTILDEVLTRLTGHYQDQSAGQRLSRQETRRQAALRRTLRAEYLAPIAQIARAHREVPGLDVAMRTPQPRLGTLRLVQEAEGIRAAVATQQEVFVSSGQPEDFLDRLDAAIEQLRQSIVGKARNVGTHVGAKRGLADEIRAGRKAVYILDTIVRAAFKGQGTVLARWNVAKRVKQASGGSLVVPTTGGTAGENLAVDPQPEAA